MKINIEQLPEGGLEIKTNESIPLGGGADAQSVDAELDLKVEQFAGEVFIQGEVKASLNLECGRCLKMFGHIYTFDINLTYMQEEDKDSSDKDHEVTSEELNTDFIVGSEIDLGHVVEEQILLGVPMRPLCNDNCAGICPKCGIDLNEKKCDCESGSVDPRFKVLEEYLMKKEQKDG
jgi:uncharacterized protein